MVVAYPDYQSAAGWNAITPPHSRITTNRLEESYRFVVIGSGFTGLAAARRLAELNPHEQVLVLEAARIGEGSSGRNSGFLISTPHNASMSGRPQAEAIAKKQIQLNRSAQDWLHELVCKHQIACHWNPTGKYNAAATPAGAAGLKAGIAALESWGVDVRVLRKHELEEAFGTPYYRYGYHTSHNVFVQPAALVHGLVDSLPPNVVLQECTPVLGLQTRGGITQIRLRERTIRADKVVLANNGFAKAFGFLKSRLVVIYTYAGMTPQLTEYELAQHGHEPEWGLIPANRLGTTLRKVNNARFMVRSAYSYEKELPLKDSHALLTQLYKKRYPHLKSHRFEYTWGGTTALTRNGAYYFGELTPGIYAAVGCNGSGVLKGTAYGKLLAELIMGQDSSLLRDAMSLIQPSWMPPEPLRAFAIKSAISYQRRRAGMEQ